MYISGPYTMKVLHTQQVINTHIQHGRAMLSGRFRRLALRRYGSHNIGRQVHAGGGQAPLPGGHDRLPLLPLHLRQRRFGLGQPEGHVHGAVQRNGGGQLGSGLLRASRLSIQGAKAKVAVRQEGAHPQFLGQGEGLLVVGLGQRALRGLAMSRNVAEEAEGIRLVAMFLVRTGELLARARRGPAPPPGGQPAAAPPPGRGYRTPASPDSPGLSGRPMNLRGRGQLQPCFPGSPRRLVTEVIRNNFCNIQYPRRLRKTEGGLNGMNAA